MSRPEWIRCRCVRDARYLSSSRVAHIYRCSIGHVQAVAMTEEELRESRTTNDVRSGYEVPPPVHADAHDTEIQAAEKIKPRAKALRAAVLALARSRGARGVIGWEAVVELEMEEHETSVRPRLTELCEERHDQVLRKTSLRRVNAHHGNGEMVYVAAEHYVEAVHGRKK